MPLLVTNLISSAADTVRAGSGYAVNTLSSLIFPEAPLIALRLLVELQLDATTRLTVTANTQQADKVVPIETQLEAKSITDVPVMLTSFLAPLVKATQTEPVFVKCILRTPNPEEREITYDCYAIASVQQAVTKQLTSFLSYHQSRLKSQRVRSQLDRLFTALFAQDYFALTLLEAQKQLNLFLVSDSFQQSFAEIKKDATVAMTVDPAVNAADRVLLQIQTDAMSLPERVSVRYRHTTHTLDLSLLPNLQRKFIENTLPLADFSEQFRRVNAVAAEVNQLTGDAAERSLDEITQMVKCFNQKWAGDIRMDCAVDEGDQTRFFTVTSVDALIDLRLATTSATRAPSL